MSLMASGCLSKPGWLLAVVSLAIRETSQGLEAEAVTGRTGVNGDVPVGAQDELVVVGAVSVEAIFLVLAAVFTPVVCKTPTVNRIIQ